MKKMNLLVITNNTSRPSFRQRIKIHLQTLHRNGINCEVAKLPSEELKRLRLFKQAANFDCILLQKKCLNFLDTICLRKYSKKIIYDLDDAIMYSPNRPTKDNTSHFKLFRRTVKSVDMVIAGNLYLAEHVKRFNNNVRVLPTGLDIKDYDQSTDMASERQIRLAWIGSKSTLKYLIGIKPALEELGARFPNVVLRIICNDFFNLENMEVEKLHWSLDNQAKYLATADIGLAPLPDNRFTKGKCGFKILQYQAACLPVITSPVGVNAKYVNEGVTGYLASDNNQWIDRISKLIENSKLRKQMASAAKIQVAKFDSNIIGARLSKLIADFLEN